MINNTFKLTIDISCKKVKKINEQMEKLREKRDTEISRTMNKLNLTYTQYNDYYKDNIE